MSAPAMKQSGEEGLSHFLEHMFFKGTRRRSAIQISREIDALGGEMNAFTTRETTTFYVKVLDQHLEAALELLSDLFYHSRFDSKRSGEGKEGRPRRNSRWFKTIRKIWFKNFT